MAISKARKKNVLIILDEQEIIRAEEHLKGIDPILAEVINTYSPCTIHQINEDSFKQLCASILGQQLSVKAAQSIRNRVLDCVGSFTPENVEQADSNTLRSKGLSWAKIKYIKALASMVLNGDLLLDELRGKNSHEVIAELLKVPGIGIWTAEMFLIFNLAHSNVLSIGDAGLQRAVKKLYGENYNLQKVSKKWTPYASVASWYLWRFIDAAPTE